MIKPTLIKSTKKVDMSSVGVNCETFSLYLFALPSFLDPSVDLPLLDALLDKLLHTS